MRRNVNKKEGDELTRSPLVGQNGPFVVESKDLRKLGNGVEPKLEVLRVSKGERNKVAKLDISRSLWMVGIDQVKSGVHIVEEWI